MVAISYLPLDVRGLITVGGEDRRSFLQGLISNDIERVTPERAIWAALLTPQGKYLHDFFIAEIGNTFFVDCEAARLTDLGQRLSRYKLRAKVDLGIAADHEVVALYGDGALAALGLPEEPGAAQPLGGGVAFCDPRLPEIGARAFLPNAATERTLGEIGAVRGDAQAYDRLRMTLGLPDGSRDIQVEKATLLENNFDHLHGVDWRKGCYVGQELTARTKYRGLVKKRLVPVEIEGPAPEPGTQVLLGDKDAGELRSHVDGMGLALLRIDQMAKSLAGEGELTAGAARLVARPPRWIEVG